MKKLLVVLMLLAISTTAFAALAWCGNSYVVVNGVWYDGSASVKDNDFEGYDFGAISSLVLGGEIQSWDTSGDEAFFAYIIDGGAASYIELPYNRPEGSNDLWQASPGTTVDISGLSDGAHTLAIWFAVTDLGAPATIFDNNGGANYTASFTTSGATPITLSSFTAKAKQGVVELAWTTESETENSHFLVYRDGDVIAQVDGAGTTSESNDYVVVDNAVMPGVHEYALADVSYAGIEKVHETVSVEVSATVSAANFVLKNAYPNPFNPRTAISYDLTSASDLNVSIYNTSGNLVETLFNGEHAAGSYELTWDAANMPSGVYVLSMRAGNVMTSQKLVLMK